MITALSDLNMGGFQRARSGMISVFSICVHLYVHAQGDTESHEGNVEKYIHQMLTVVTPPDGGIL